MEEQTGGKGGDAASYRYSSSWQARYAGGGAGNTGGVGKYTFSGQTTGANWEDGRGQNGTGGLLVIFSNFSTFSFCCGNDIHAKYDDINSPYFVLSSPTSSELSLICLPKSFLSLIQKTQTFHYASLRSLSYKKL